MMDSLITRFHRAKCREEEGSDDVDGVGNNDAASDIEGGEYIQIHTTLR